MKYYDKLIFELSKPGRCGYSLPCFFCGSQPHRESQESDIFAGSQKSPISSDPTTDVVPPLPCRGRQAPVGLAASEKTAAIWRETELVLPEVSEPDVVRHYTNLSQMNFGVDTGFYPLGSCTMKYNPKINEEIVSQFNGIHPLQPAETVEGVQAVYDFMDKALAAITGMKHFTFLPCAGAHGELTGLMLMREYHLGRGDLARTKVIVPDSAHGTNPASAAVCGLDIVVVKSRPDGLVDVEDLKPLLGPDIAGIMMTNPNTLGMFERDIREIAELVRRPAVLRRCEHESAPRSGAPL